ncbi:MAG: drug/metabolite exporter YedA [Ktedonobacteraceae bacterium]
MSNTHQTKSTFTAAEGGSIGALPPAPTGSRFGVLFALLAVYLIWGSTYLGIRIALTGFPPFFMSGLRFVIAGAILFAVMRLRGVAMPTRAQWLGAAGVGSLFIVGGYGGVTFAEQWVSSGLAATGAGASPLWTALFLGLMGRWPTRKEGLGLVSGFIGVVLLNLEHSVWANPLGAIALILAPICWAFGTSISGRVSLPGGLMSSAVQMLIGGCALLVISFLAGERVQSFPPVNAMLALGYLIVFGSIIAFSAYGYLLLHVRPTLATSYAYVNPVIAICLGIILASEHISVMGILAVAIILIGVVLVMQRGGKH